MNKELCIVTNFGCDKKCSHCLSRDTHPLLQERTKTIDWEEIENAILRTSPESKEILLGGGADPFYRYENRSGFYSVLAGIARTYKRTLAVRTKTLPLDSAVLKNFKRIFYLVDTKDDLTRIKRSLWWVRREVEIIPVKVVDYLTKDCDIIELLGMVKDCGLGDLYIEKPVGSMPGRENYKLLKECLKGAEGIIWANPWGKYRYFFMTDNKLHEYYFADGKEENAAWISGLEEINRV